MSSYRIGMNLRVTEDSNQGGRRYMEDRHAIRFVKNEEGGFEFAYFGIFDGHGGGEASKYARDYLLDEITKYDCFWNDNDEDILYAIKSAFLDCHYGMWKEVDKWPRTGSGLPSTAGTTASIGIIKNSKLYIGHVGDSAITIGRSGNKSEKLVHAKAKMLTKDHKPDDPVELKRIEKSGGQVVAKSGVQRVVWNRPRTDHRGPIRRSTQIDRIPFLAVARSLGDLWSYNYLKEEFVVSPEPDVSVHKLNPDTDKCLVIGSDGLWNMLSAEESVGIVFDLESQFEYKVINDPTVPLSYWINPAERLVQAALNKWRMRLMKADNTSAIVVLIDPLGPRKLSILRKKREERMKEVAEKRLNNKSVTEMLTANETLTNITPKKSKVVINPDHTELRTKPVIGDGLNDSVAPCSTKSVPVIPNKAHVNMDDSIQLRNGHLASPVTHPAGANQDTKPSTRSSPVSLRNKASPHASKSDQPTVTTRMATRQSPQKSPLGQNSVCNSQSLTTDSPSKSPMQSRSANQAQQKCLQPSKCTLDNVKNTVSPKVPADSKLGKDLENIYSSVTQFGKGQLNLRTNSGRKTNSNKNSNSCSSFSGDTGVVKSTRKAHSTKSLTTRISLRLRRLRQKTQKVNKGQTENKGYTTAATKPGVKRKLDSGNSCGTPANKKVKHSHS